MARPIDPRPTLLEAMKHHHITLKRLSVSVSAVFPKDVEAIVMQQIGTPEDIDLCLRAFSSLAEQTYSRREIAGFTYLGSKADTNRLRRYRFADGTSAQELERLRDYDVTISPTLHQLEGLPSYWEASVPPGTYYASFPARMFEGRGVTDDDILMVLPLGLQVHTCLHHLRGHIYHQIMGLYDPAVPTWHR